jgi:hypothetical protein
LRSSDVADIFPPFHAEAQSLKQHFSESFINESSLEISNLILIILNIVFVSKYFFMPLGIFQFNLLNYFAFFLHNSEIVLVSPSLEIHELVIPRDFHESIIDPSLTGDTEVIGLLLPLEEERKELLAHHGSYDEAGSELVFFQEGGLTINVELFGIPYCDIYIFFDSDVKCHKFHLLTVLS